MYCGLFFIFYFFFLYEVMYVGNLLNMGLRTREHYGIED